jgi:hypothetical protein
MMTENGLSLWTGRRLITGPASIRASVGDTSSVSNDNDLKNEEA